MKVLIVARTKMQGNRRCIGALSEDTVPLRLLTSSGVNQDTQSPLQVGQWWDIASSPVRNPKAPHTEDVLVTRQRFLGACPNLRDYLLQQVHPWRGGVDILFDGLLQFTMGNSAYICVRTGVPANSTGFWIPDRDLRLEAEEGAKPRYSYRNRLISNVGENSSIPNIPAGTLVRVSLARWWKPKDSDPSFEERCYLQLSGWYL